MKTILNFLLLMPTILFFETGQLFSQEVTLRGTVIDSTTGSPLQGSNVYLVQGKRGTVTDKRGIFEFSVEANEILDTLVVNYLGYEEYRIQVKNHQNDSVIHLTTSILALEKGITVFAEKFDLSKQEIPHTPHVINYQQIERQGTIEISDLFKRDPSIRIEGNDLDGRKIQIRGSDPDEVNIYIDGILINDISADNEADLSVIPVDNIEKLEILKGANLILLGSGAFGGVVNITTRKKLESELALNFKYGSATNRYIASAVSLPLTKKLYLNYFGNFNKINPEIELFPSERFAIKSTSSFIKTMKQNHHLSLNYYTNQGHYAAKLIGYFLDYDKPDWINQRKNLMLAGAYQGDLLFIKNLDIALNYLYNNDVIRREAPRDAEYVSTFLSQRMHLRLTKNFSAISSDDEKLSVQLLSEYFHDELFDKMEVQEKSRKGRLYDGYLYENRASLGAVVSFANKMDRHGLMSWQTFFGIRSDFMANGKWYKTTSYGIQLETNWGDNKISPYVSFGENIKIPSLQESATLNHLQNLSEIQEGVEAIKLIPENSSSYESGIHYNYQPENFFFKEINFNFAFYSTRIFNKMLKTRLGNAIVQRLLGEVKTKGIEAMLKLDEVYSNINLGLSYGLLDVNNPLLYAYKPDRRYGVHVEYIPHAEWYVTGIFFYEGRSIAWNYSDQLAIEIVEVPSFFDLDLIFGYNFYYKKLQIQLQTAGYNFLDNAGYQFYDLKKRFLQIGLAIKY